MELKNSRWTETLVVANNKKKTKTKKYLGISHEMNEQ